MCISAVFIRTNFLREKRDCFTHRQNTWKTKLIHLILNLQQCTLFQAHRSIMGVSSLVELLYLENLIVENDASDMRFQPKFCFNNWGPMLNVYDTFTALSLEYLITGLVLFLIVLSQKPLPLKNRKSDASSAFLLRCGRSFLWKTSENGTENGLTHFQCFHSLCIPLLSASRLSSSEWINDSASCGCAGSKLEV